MGLPKGRTNNPKGGKIGHKPGNQFLDLKLGQEVTEKEGKFARKLVELLGQGVKRSKAIRMANDYAYVPSKASRNVSVYYVLGRERVQRYISELLNKAGLGHEAVTRDLRRAITLGLASGDAKVSDAIKGLEIAIRMNNLFPAKKVEAKIARYNADMLTKKTPKLHEELKDLEDEEKILAEEAEVIFEEKEETG